VSASLLVLCLAAFGIIAAALSCALGVALHGLDRLAGRIVPRHRVRLWLGLAVLPAAAGGMAILVSLLPALGLGDDHCLAHGLHHPHLCPHHVGGAPGILLVAAAALTALRFLHGAVACARDLRLSQRISRALAEASDRTEDVFVFPSDRPQAFVLGAVRPHIYMSRALVALGNDIAVPVLAHERVHVRRRDPLWRALCAVFAVGHLPSVAAAIRSRVCTAQEMAADAEGADTLADGRLKIAEALVFLAGFDTASPGLAFTHGDVQTRVRVLLRDPAAHLRCLSSLLLAGCVVVAATIGWSHDAIHHGLETLLGALS
jgi:hypothetical protein